MRSKRPSENPEYTDGKGRCMCDGWPHRVTGALVSPEGYMQVRRVRESMRTRFRAGSARKAKNGCCCEIEISLAGKSSRRPWRAKGGIQEPPEAPISKGAPREITVVPARGKPDSFCSLFTLCGQAEAPRKCSSAQGSETLGRCYTCSS